MTDTLKYIADKFGLNLDQRPPIEILKINRTIMAQTLHELGLNVGAEIGVAQGDHAKLICENVPGVKLYCVDVWETYDGYREYRDRITRYYEQAKAKLAPYNCVFVKKFSMDAVNDFADGELDFVYIDGAHDFLNVAMDICRWTKKVRMGGIIYGHDFKRSKGRYVNDVKDVIPAYMYAHGVRPWFVLGERGRYDGVYREGTQSWMFVRGQYKHGY